MKILYIGSERRDAQAVATALRGVERDVTVSWASRLEPAVKWIDENRDLAALVVEAQPDGGSWPSVLKHVRGPAMHPAVVAIVPEGFGPPFESLRSEADDYIPRNPSLLRDLPLVVTRAVARARGHQALQHALNSVAETKERVEVTSPSPLDLERAARADLEQKLAHATAALQEAEQRHLDASAAADQQLAERQAQYEIGMARAAATWEMVDEQLRAAALEVEHARQNHASAAADVDRLSRRELELSAQLAEAAVTHSVLARRVADAETAVAAAHSSTEQERVAAAEREAERQREFQTQIAQEVDKRRGVEDWLAQSVSALDDEEKRHALAMADAAAQSRELEESLRLVRQDLNAKAADVERLTTRETDLISILADLTTSRDDLERRLVATEAAFEDAGRRATRERLAASKKAAAREAELDGQVRQERATRATLEQAVADADAALHAAQQRHDAALVTAANELAERQAHFDRELSQTAADRDRITQQLSEVEVALDQVQRDHQSSAADVDRLTQREADLASQLANVEAARDSLELQLADATGAINHAATRQIELDGQIEQERVTRAALEQAIADADAALREAKQQHDATLTTAANELAERQAHFDRELSQTAADRDRLTEREADLTSQLANVEATRDRLELQLADASSAISHATARQIELDGQLDQERATRATLERAIADADAALHAAQQRHDTALATAANELAERQAHFDRELSQTAADRDRITQHLNDVEVALDQVRRDHQSSAADVERLTRREADLTSQLATVEAARDNLELQLADATNAISHAAARQTDLEGQIEQERVTRATLEQAIAGADAALRDARQQHDAALADLTSQLANGEAARDSLELQLADATRAIGRATAHEAELDGQIEQERATRVTLEQAIADADAALRDARQQHDAELARAANEIAERQAHFDGELSRTAADRDRLTQRETDLISQLANVEATRDSLDLQLADVVRALADADERAAGERTAAADRQANLETQLAHEIATRDSLEQTLAETRSAALATERSLHEEAAALRARGLEQQAHFEVQLAQEQLEHESRLAEMQECTRTLALERDALLLSLSTMQEQSHRAHTELQEKLTATFQELEVMKRRQAVLQTEADEVPRLQARLDESRAESHRLFEQAGLAMFRCTPDGTLTHANRACTTLIGRRTPDELGGVHFAAAVFEAPTVLSWLIERCLSTKAKESIETTWRRKDGARLFVRLSARLAAPDVIEVVAEDITRLRVLQERLDHAHRMEAVGRLASEVAVTCGTLLSDIHQKGRVWLTTASGNPDSQHYGELLLDEVRRAAGLLQQLAECGDEQVRTPMLVDLNTLIHDLRPVLKRVAGGDVDVQVRDTSSPLHVDVGTEQVERLLVNLASYGRERMPSGGRLKIELGTIVVDRRFVTRHPNVRLGLHALITVTELRRAARANKVQPLHDGGTTTETSPGKVARKPGVDFATLQELVTECGGHLWMKVQPLGDMVAKIRLPLLNPHDQTLPRSQSARSGRERSTPRRLPA